MIRDALSNTRLLPTWQMARKISSISLGALLAISASFSARAYHFPWDQGHDVTRKQEAPESPEAGGCEDSLCQTDVAPSSDMGCGPKRSPVIVSTGRFQWNETDVALAGYGNIQIARTFNSQEPRSGIFGNGWTVSCEISLLKTVDQIETDTGVEAQEQYVLRTGSGKRYTWLKDAEGVYQPPAGKFDTIEVLENGHANLIKLDGSSAEFDAVGRLVARRDANKKEVLYRYDDEDRLTQIGDAHGRSLNLNYGLNGRVATVTDHSGRQWVYDYDASGNLVTVTDPVGGVRKYKYQDYLLSTDPQKWHQLTRITDATGVVVTEVTYNGHKVRSYTEGANKYSYSYDVRNSRVTKTDSLKSAWTFTYDSHGQIITDANPMGQSVFREYDSNGYQQKFTDATGNDWPSQFDPLGRKLSTANPYGQTTLLEYKGDKPWPVKVTTPGGRSSSLTYDNAGNLLTMTDPSGAVTQMKWSDTGYPTQTKDALGNTATMTWSPVGLMLSSTDPLGRTTRIQYDDLGRPVKTLRPDGQSSTVAYDALDRVVAATDALNQTTQFTYDAAGRLLTVTDAAGGVTEFRYDQYGRQISETRPDGSTITRTYRTDNLLASSSDPRGIETTYQYDTAKRLLQVDAQGEVTKYTYDATGRMLTATNPESQLSWTYDKAGRILQETADGRTIAIQYNADSEPVGQNIAGETLSYVWDKRGLLSGMTSPDGTHTFNWDAIGQMKGINYPNGRTSRWDYDAAGQLTRQNYTDVAGIDYGYEYDSNGLLTNRTGDGAQWSYRYDAIDRLVSATHGAKTYRYQYDALGNRLEAGQQYDAFNKLLEDRTHTYEYDAAGNLIKKINKADSSYDTFRYNNRGRMVSFEAFAAGATTPTTTAEYAHDALGRRVLKRVNGTTTHFQWQGNKINAEYDEYGVLVKRYRFALGSSPLQYKTIGALYDVINDHLSTPRVLTNQLHSLEWVSSVSPFGVVDVEKGQSIEFNIRFPGQYFDEESGLNYNRFRDYSTKIGRYIQADPIGLNGGNNGFSYVLGNPVSLVDEYGLCPAGGVLCATGAFVVGYLAKQTPGALISASSNFGVEYAKSGDIKNAAKKGGYGLAMGYMPGGSGVGFTALKTYGGSIVGTKVVDRKSVMTADAHFNASVASAASVLTYPVTNFVVGAQPTLGQMLVAEGAGQSLEYLVGGVRDGWQNLPRDNGFMCLAH